MTSSGSHTEEECLFPPATRHATKGSQYRTMRVQGCARPGTLLFTSLGSCFECSAFCVKNTFLERIEIWRNNNQQIEKWWMFQLLGSIPQKASKILTKRACWAQPPKQVICFKSLILGMRFDAFPKSMLGKRGPNNNATTFGPPPGPSRVASFRNYSRRLW